MTTTADALEVLTLVAACHRRTAPKLDDRDAAYALAGIWAELFTAHNLDQADLLAGVKLRAQHHPDAPEPAEIIEFARKVRRDRRAVEGPSAAYEALCESKSEDAAELAELRRERALTGTAPRPKLGRAFEVIANSKAIPSDYGIH